MGFSLLPANGLCMLAACRMRVQWATRSAKQLLCAQPPFIGRRLCTAPNTPHAHAVNMQPLQKPMAVLTQIQMMWNLLAAHTATGEVHCSVWRH